MLDKLDDFRKRITWFENYRKKNNKFWPNEERSDGKTILLSLVPKERVVFLLQRLLDETQFLSPWGIRALSKYHEQNPFSVTIRGIEYKIHYEPGDSTSDMFGGNSNWRGPLWMPINYIIIQSIRHFGEFYGNELEVECPIGSGNKMNLVQVAEELTRRLITLFQPNQHGKRPSHGAYSWFYQAIRKCRSYSVLRISFMAKPARDLGASHQTGWTALVAELVHSLTEKQYFTDEPPPEERSNCTEICDPGLSTVIVYYYKIIRDF